MKNIIIIISICLSISLCFACNTANTTNNNSNSNINETKIDKIIGMPNPMVAYDDLGKLMEACDFRILFPKNIDNYTNPKYYLISNAVADCRFTNKNNENEEISYRSSIGNKDISGYFGYTPTDDKILDVDVHTYKTNDGFASWWTYNNMSFSISVKNINKKTYTDLLNEAIKLSKEL